MNSDETTRLPGKAPEAGEKPGRFPVFSGKRIFWIGLVLALVAVLWFWALPTLRYSYANWYLSSAKRFNIEEATKNGIVYIPVNSQRFAIPKEYVGGVSSSHDGSVSSIYLRFILPELERYDPNNPRHKYEFSAARGGGHGGQLQFFLRERSVPRSPDMLGGLYQRNVVKQLDSPSPKQKVTRRAPEADDPEGLEIYSTPNYQFTWPNGVPDNKPHWTAGKDIYVLRDGEKVLYYAECVRVIPEVRSPGCKVDVEFSDEVRGEYDFGRPHIKDWKRIHEHLTRLVRGWMLPIQPSPASPQSSSITR